MMACAAAVCEGSFVVISCGVVCNRSADPLLSCLQHAAPPEEKHGPGVPRNIGRGSSRSAPERNSGCGVSRPLRSARLGIQGPVLGTAAYRHFFGINNKQKVGYRSFSKEKVGSRNTPASHVVECRVAAEPGRLRPWLRVASKEGLRTTADAGRVVALVPPSRGGCTGREA